MPVGGKIDIVAGVHDHDLIAFVIVVVIIVVMAIAMAVAVPVMPAPAPMLVTILAALAPAMMATMTMMAMMIVVIIVIIVIIIIVIIVIVVIVTVIVIIITDDDFTIRHRDRLRPAGLGRQHDGTRCKQGSENEATGRMETGFHTPPQRGQDLFGRGIIARIDIPPKRRGCILIFLHPAHDHLLAVEAAGIRRNCNLGRGCKESVNGAGSARGLHPTCAWQKEPRIRSMRIWPFGHSKTKVRRAFPSGDTKERSAESHAAGSRPQHRSWRGAARFQAQDVLEAIDEPLILVNRRLRLLWANRMGRMLLGAHAEIGRDIRLYLRTREIVTALEQVARSAASAPVQLVTRHRQGQRESVYALHLHRIHAAERQDDTEEEPGILLHLRDISALDRAERMRADFIANVSHELKTPLAALIGFIETLRGPARDDPAARERFLALMDAEARRMNRLVGDLLSLSKLESEPPPARDARADLVAVTQRVLTLMQPVAVQAHIGVQAQIIPDRAPVRGEEDRLVQMLTNLLDNAIKYGKPGPVTVSLTAEGDAWVLTVADRGPGIPAEHLPRLTERFYRVDTARSRSLGGTGLGLALVKHIVRKHEGRLEIESRPGAGTTVTVRLPRLDEPDGKTASAGQTGRQPNRPVM